MESPKSNFQNSMQYRYQKREESPSRSRRSHRKSLKKSEIKLQSFEILKQTIFGKIEKNSIKPTKKSLSRVMKACGAAAEKQGPRAEHFKYVHKLLFQKLTSGKSNLSLSEKRESERIERLKMVTSSGLNKDFESVMEGLNQKVSALTTQDLDEDILSYEDMEMRTPKVGEKGLSKTIGNFLKEMRNEADIDKLNETVKIMSLDQGIEMMTTQMVEKGPSETFDDFLRGIRNDVDIYELNETVTSMSLDQGFP